MENNQTDINVLIKRRYEELEELKKKGFEPFAYSFDTDTYSTDIKNDFKKEIPSVSSNDFKVIIDYDVEGERFVKIKNNKTGKIYTVRYGDKSGEIVLMERRLTYYIFKINNQNIRISRWKKHFIYLL